MLGLALGLAGCAAGSPAAVVPDPADGQPAAPAVAAPELTPLAVSDGPDAAPAVGAAQDAVAPQAAGQEPAPASDVAAVAEPASGGNVDPAVPASDVAASSGQVTSGAPAAAANPAETVPIETAAVAPATTDPAAAGAPAAASGVEAPAFAAAPAVAGVGAAQEAGAPAAPIAPETTDPPVAAAAQETGRPPVPATDGSGLSQLIEGHDDGRKEVALTFDAGSDRGYTEQILDLLRDSGIKGTFGMTGAFAEANPDLIQRMAAEGHQLINHTWSHGSMTGANTGEPAWTYEELADELARTEQVVRDITGGYELKPYFRPPYGDYDETSLGYLYELGYPFTVMWSCDTQGWRGWDAAKILEYCTSVPLEDDIILMHVGASAAGDYEVLPSMIAWYQERGYAFVTVEQMMQP